jgi:2,4-dienoyl-CoA reductase-like NADH-dependent reductase (Old Yellow Enzyme family)
VTGGLFEPVPLASGGSLPNRFMLSPLTNTQSNADGTLSDAEHHWLLMRAEGGFGLTMTCASHVQAIGQGFPGQLGCWDDAHTAGLTRLAADIRAAGSGAWVQLHHAGMRSPSAIIGGAPVCPSGDESTGAREMTPAEVEEMIEAFITAAVRCERAGFDGVELHGAHGYLLSQFLSPDINRRTDRWGGSEENRARPILDIVEGIRARCAPGFGLAVRLSPERFGMRIDEIERLYAQLAGEGRVDLIDMSLWDWTKEPEEESRKGTRLIDVFAGIDRGRTVLAVAGKIYSGADCAAVVDAGADVAAIGRAAILNHDFPERVRADATFRCRETPVSATVLEGEGLSPPFVTYMRNWPGFVSDE